MKTSRWSSAIILLIVGLIVGYGTSYVYQPQTQKLSSQVSDLQTEVTSLQGQISSLQNRLSASDTQMTSVQRQLSQVDAELSQTQTELTQSKTQLSQLENLNKARESIKVVRWLLDCPLFSETCSYQVKVTNNNNFDVTLKQIIVSLVDSSGNQISSGTGTQSVSVGAGNSVTITVNVTARSDTAGVSAQVTLSTPYGDVVTGTI